MAHTDDQKKAQAANHPTKEATIKVEPITDTKAIGRIKKLLADDPRNLCLFTFGINTNLRASDEGLANQK